ncbi:hypothetical protein FOCC_FOCC008662 [Frankliniella occidentalis]|nr:hypothetical protein FOCC_FOCC009670 [Frankliniella occidentalis]KAE8744659.1 hypothetical protein FOCC_FOCC008662 [Frankliniella occidentalis]
MGKFFKLSAPSISNIVKTWVRFMSIKFKSLKAAMCIVDATEIKIQKPKNFEQQSNTYSSYKGTNTAKFLVACSAYGGLSFISEGYEGNISDRKLFLQSEILDHINAGEAVMVDRGFDIEADLNKRGIDLIIPPFLGDRQAFTEREMFIGKAVATSRIHIETLIGRTKHFRLVTYVYPNSMLDLLSDVMHVCSVLCNFNEPFVRWEEEEVADVDL